MSQAPNFTEVDPGLRVLMGPGPSDVSPKVLRAMAAPCIGHLDPYFLTKMDETQTMLRYIFETEHALTMPISGTGSAGMETCLVNLIEPGDKVMVCVNGVFGARMADIVERLGGELIRLDFPWGRAVAPETVLKKAKEAGPDLICVVHAETSTGAVSSLSDLSQAAGEVGALFVVDCVTSLGGMPVGIDANKVDAAYSGTQKCLSCPPGLSPVTLSSRALDKLNRRKQKVVSWYLDLTMLGSYWGAERKYHHTAPINMIFALHQALRDICTEGLETRFERHRLHHKALVAAMEGMGLSMVVPENERLPMLNTVYIPQGADDLGVRKALLNQYGIEIGGGLGDLAGKVWRVGLMGSSANRRNLTLFITALKSILEQQGVKIKPGALGAMNNIYDQ